MDRVEGAVGGLGEEEEDVVHSMDLAPHRQGVITGVHRSLAFTPSSSCARSKHRSLTSIFFEPLDHFPNRRSCPSSLSPNSFLMLLPSTPSSAPPGQPQPALAHQTSSPRPGTCHTPSVLVASPKAVRPILTAAK